MNIVSTFGLPQHAWLQEYPMAAVIVVVIPAGRDVSKGSHMSDPSMRG